MDECFFKKVKRYLNDTSDDELRHELLQEIEIRLTLIAEAGSDTDMMSIFIAVCDAYNVTPAIVKANNHSRFKPYPEIRQICFQIWSDRFGYKPTLFGRFFEKDHATVKSSIKAITGIIDTDRLFRTRLHELLPQYFKN